MSISSSGRSSRRRATAPKRQDELARGACLRVAHLCRAARGGLPPGSGTLHHLRTPPSTARPTTPAAERASPAATRCGRTRALARATRSRLLRPDDRQAHRARRRPRERAPTDEAEPRPVGDGRPADERARPPAPLRERGLRGGRRAHRLHRAARGAAAPRGPAAAAAAPPQARRALLGPSAGGHARRQRADGGGGRVGQVPVRAPRRRHVRRDGLLAPPGPAAWLRRRALRRAALPRPAPGGRARRRRLAWRWPRTSKRRRGRRGARVEPSARSGGGGGPLPRDVDGDSATAARRSRGGAGQPRRRRRVVHLFTEGVQLSVLVSTRAQARALSAAWAGALARRSLAMPARCARPRRRGAAVGAASRSSSSRR